jgi:hypothetical protein
MGGRWDLSFEQRKSGTIRQLHKVGLVGFFKYRILNHSLDGNIASSVSISPSSPPRRDGIECSHFSQCFGDFYFSTFIGEYHCAGLVVIEAGLDQLMCIGRNTPLDPAEQVPPQRQFLVFQSQHCSLNPVGQTVPCIKLDIRPSGTLKTHID